MKKLLLIFAMFVLPTAAMANSGKTVDFAAAMFDNAFFEILKEENISINSRQKQCFDNSHKEETAQLFKETYLSSLSAKELKDLDAFFSTKLGQDMIKYAAEYGNIDEMSIDGYDKSATQQLLSVKDSLNKIGQAFDREDYIEVIYDLYFQKADDCNIEL